VPKPQGREKWIVADFETYSGLEFDFIIFDEATEMAKYNDPPDRLPKHPDYFNPGESPFTGEPRWLRERREREKAVERELMRQFEEQRQREYNLRNDRLLIRTPPIQPKPIPVRGDYLVYYLGGPSNATQEYFFDKILPKDQTSWDVAEAMPMEFPLPEEPTPRTIQRHRYKLRVIPQYETPFSAVQVYLALYQEPPL
jgi:hypothetical protein